MKTIKQLLLILIVVFFNSCSKNENDLKLIPVKAGDKWGYIDKEGKYIINAQFDLAYIFSEGLALVQAGDGKWGYIGEDGKYIINPMYKYANKFSEGLACAVMDNGKPQFINKEGKIMFTVEDAQTCGGFSEGLAPVKIKGKWGFIDNTGKVIINAEYEEVNKFSEGLASVAKLDIKTKEKKWGFIDNKGGIKIDFQFKSDTTFWASPEYFSEGLTFVSSDGKKWGCINKDGKYEVNPQYDGALFQPYVFKNGASLIKQGENYGYIDKTGKYIINPQFTNAYNFSSNGLAAVENSDKKFGFIDKEGKFVINPQFEGVEIGFIGEIGFVKSSEKYGIINEKGTYLVNPQFDDVQLYDRLWIYNVESDYIDNSEVAKSFFENSDDLTVRNISSTSTLNDIITEYPNTPSKDLKSYKLSIEKPNLTIKEVLEIVDIKYYFSNNTFSDVPIYKNVQKYDAWSGGYNNSKEFDHFEKKYNTDVNVTAVAYNMKLEHTGSGKSQKLADELKNIAIKKMKLELIPHSETNNNNEKGMFILKNENILMQLYYYEVKSEDGKRITPGLSITVVNKNYASNTFDELEKSFIEGYLKGDKKDKS